MKTSEMDQVSQFFYFMNNVWNERVCHEIFGPRMGEHFWGKYTYYCGKHGSDYAMTELYLGMDFNNRITLLNAAFKHYRNQ